MKTPSDFILDCFINSTTEAITNSHLTPEDQGNLLADIEDRFLMRLSAKIQEVKKTI